MPALTILLQRPSCRGVFGAPIVCSAILGDVSEVNWIRENVTFDFQGASK